MADRLTGAQSSVALPASELLVPQTLTPAASGLSGHATRTLPATAVDGVTPRSSGELFSLGNNSSETLMSEYLPRLQPRSRLGSTLRRPENVRSAQAAVRPRPESLMMGYVQITGSFTLDGSLVNRAPFEEVKRKGVIGSHGGGGVVGVGTKASAGIFGALGWGQIGQSLGGLLGDGGLSSLKEMKGDANSKVIPLLRTPPSIIFIDLRLAPGEKKSYRYRFTIPRGLPPTHRGRAIRISYALVLGTQRASTAQQSQPVRQTEFPFRVFGGVDGRDHRAWGQRVTCLCTD